MKDIIELERRYGGAPHKLIKIEDKKYVFRTAEDWMPIYVTGEPNNVVAIDSEGGPYIGIGDKIEDGIVKAINWVQGKGYVIDFE